MIGRKHRKRVVYVDGIPIESTILDAGESGELRDKKTSDPAALAMLDPRMLFDKYDTDGSGGIDFAEFQVLLHDLQIRLSEPKALAYFKKCDKLHRGSISFEEFRLALYTCDPKNPNRTGGFAPGQSLAPKDLFEMFDKEEQGAIDRATFIEILEFLGQKMPLDKMEAIFAAHEDPELDMMGYYQFKKAWLTIVDVRAELRNRHEKFNRFLPNSSLMKKLELLINIEEKQEARTLLEATNTLEDERIASERRKLVEEAQLLSRMVLTEALDAAGQVYVFGKGPFGRFDGDAIEPDFIDFMDYEIVKHLWKERVQPGNSTTSIEAITDTRTKEKIDTKEHIDGNHIQGVEMPSRARIWKTTTAYAFADRQISLMTAFLWGKRVKHVSCGLSVAYALTDSGEVFCWGGNKRQWRYFYDEWTQGNDENNSPGKRDDQQSGSEGGEMRTKLDQYRPLTTRSEMLKLSTLTQVVENRRNHDQLQLRKKYRKVFVQPVRLLPTEEENRHKLQLVGQYYDLLPDTSSDSATNSSQSQFSYQDLMETVEPELNVDDLALSLQMRGVYLAKQTRVELMEKLGDCLALELECLGSKFHYHMKDQDIIARRLRHDHHEKQMLIVMAKSAGLWNELRLLQEAIVKVENERFTKEQEEYLDMKLRIAAAKQKLKRQAREGISLTNSAKSGLEPQPQHGSPTLHVNGLTARGPRYQFFNGDEALYDIAVGSRHALAIHNSGKLLTWGVGSFGRLGGIRHTMDHQNPNPENDPDAWHSDVHAPQFIDSLTDIRFQSVACGFGHSLALSTRGQVFVWGSATHGKLGLGKIKAQESFTLIPMALPLPSGKVVRKISCGPSHSALLTTEGNLFVWGCGDGGKLGLGDHRDIGENLVPRNGGNLRVIDSPTLVVEPFANEKLVEVSCGSAHTAVLSAITNANGGHSNADGGGQLYVAGSNHALNNFTPIFTELSVSDSDGRPVMMTKVSCGNAHTAVVSRDGELYTWGRNVGGCTGHSILTPIINAPTRVACMYQRPANLCVEKGVIATQSSQNATYAADFALGLNSCEYAQTQQEICPFWEVMLREMSRIESIRVVIKKSSTSTDTFEGTYTKRPFSSSGAVTVKYTTLISEFPFDSEERGKYSLMKAKSHSIHSSFSLRNDQSEWTWAVPFDTFGRFVRIQLESGMGMLSLFSVEVIGSGSMIYKGPRVSDVTCSDGITVAICKPISSQDVLRERYLRAIRADQASQWILEQLETFHAFLGNNMSKLNDPGNELTHRHTSCVLCGPKEKCVICSIEELVDAAGKSVHIDSKASGRDHPAGVQQNVNQKRIKSNANNKDEPRLSARLTLVEKCQILLALNKRTEEEEETAQKQLELELYDMNALAKAKQEEDEQQQRSSNTSRAIDANLLKSKRIFGVNGFASLFRVKEKTSVQQQNT